MAAGEGTWGDSPSATGSSSRTAGGGSVFHDHRPKAVQVRVDRHPEHRKGGLAGAHPGKVCRTTGKSREEIIGHDDIALFGHAIGEQVMARDAQAMREDRTVEFEEAVNSVSGPRIYHSTKGAIHDARGKVIGMYGISRDISERKRDEHALQESRAMLQTVQDSIQSQMAVLDCNGVIVAVNAAWQKFAAENASHTENAAPHSDIGINYLDVCSAARSPA